jgi:hypothetical protein
MLFHISHRPPGTPFQTRQPPRDLLKNRDIFTLAAPAGEYISFPLARTRGDVLLDSVGPVQGDPGLVGADFVGGAADDLFHAGFFTGICEDADHDVWGGDEGAGAA